MAAAVGANGIGIAVGTLAGFHGGRVDAVLMRVTEAFRTVPTFLALALVAAFGASTGNVVLAIALSSWSATARLVRAEVLTLRQRDFVDAARLAGLGRFRVAFRAVLPGALQPVVALAGVTVGAAILVESALAFLGLGDADRSSPDVLAVDGIDLSVRRGRNLVLVGESGSGKSTVLLAVAGLLPPTASVEGDVRLHGRPIMGLPERERARVRGRGVGMVFQDPGGSLNPVLSVGTQIDEVVRVRGRACGWRWLSLRASLSARDRPLPGGHPRLTPFEQGRAACGRAGELRP